MINTMGHQGWELGFFLHPDSLSLAGTHWSAGMRIVKLHLVSVGGVLWLFSDVSHA